MRFPRWMAAALWAAFPCVLHPEAVKDREGAVRQDKAAMEHDSRWIYNDWEKGFAEGKRTGKPVLVVLRCVPCLACAGIDAQVLLQETDLAPLLDQFVCVRVINANALDLSLFQVDYDLSFSTVFFNGDGTVYGRYGSWVHQKDSKDKTTSGFKAALNAALKLHAGYPANKDSLVGKQGVKGPYATTLDIPFVFSSNGDGFVFHDRTGTSTEIETNLTLSAFPSPSDLWARYRAWKGLTPEAEQVVLQDYYDDASGTRFVRSPDQCQDECSNGGLQHAGVPDSDAMRN